MTSLSLCSYFQYRIETIEPAAFYTVTFLASLGIAFAFVCLYFNLAKRKLKYNSINFKYKYIFQGKMFHFNLKWNIILRYIKLSSPQLNNIAIIGKNSTNSRFVTSISLVGRRVTFSFVSSFERRLISTAVLSLFKKQDKSEKRNIPYLRYQYYKNKFDKSRT